MLSDYIAPTVRTAFQPDGMRRSTEEEAVEIYNAAGGFLC
jgi:hypothetical protein